MEPAESSKIAKMVLQLHDMTNTILAQRPNLVPEV